MIKQYLKYQEAKKVLRKFPQIKTSRIYRIGGYKIHRNLPSDPCSFYGKSWKGWDDFLSRKQNEAPKGAKPIKDCPKYYLYQNRVYSMQKGYFKKMKYREHPSGMLVVTVKDKKGKDKSLYIHYRKK